jgi:hypothetical protein
MLQSSAALAGSPAALRTRGLVEAPITTTLLHLSTPNVVVMEEELYVPLGYHHVPVS